jgi:hypothetical protein
MPRLASEPPPSQLASKRRRSPRQKPMPKAPSSPPPDFFSALVKAIQDSGPANSDNATKKRSEKKRSTE